MRKKIPFGRHEASFLVIITICWLAAFAAKHLRQAQAAPQAQQMSVTGIQTVGGWPIGVATGIIKDNAVIPVPPNPPDRFIAVFVLCSPYGDHSVAWPSNFVSSAATDLRRGTCVSAGYVYSAGSASWFPISQPIIYESQQTP